MVLKLSDRKKGTKNEWTNNVGTEMLYVVIHYLS